jgi:glycerol uptake facilitator-like aquaporin
VTLARAIVAEGLGTAGLLTAIVGSGIMAERLSGGNAAIALLANSAATRCALYVLIATLGRISGAHFNPVVTLLAAARRELAPGFALAYVGTQIAGAVSGVALAHLMFELPSLQVALRPRAGTGQWLGEAVATAGLVLVLVLARPAHARAIPALVATYIAAAYWFTSSTSFANPAVTIARSLTDTFTGIRPADVPGFIGAQAVGALAGVAVATWLERKPGAARAEPDA